MPAAEATAGAEADVGLGVVRELELRRRRGGIVMQSRPSAQNSESTRQQETTRDNKSPGRDEDVSSARRRGG